MEEQIGANLNRDQIKLRELDPSAHRARSAQPGL